VTPVQWRSIAFHRIRRHGDAPADRQASSIRQGGRGVPHQRWCGVAERILGGIEIEHHGLAVGFFTPKGVKIPVAVSSFPDDLYPMPRSWAERAYPKLIHYNTLPKGGHFAAWEQPAFLTEETRVGFRSLRN
jgi:pimeloyl-ACP methyl ester carboxylesterase